MYTVFTTVLALFSTGARAAFQDMGVTGCSTFGDTSGDTSKLTSGAMGLELAQMDPFEVKAGQSIKIKMNGTTTEELNNAKISFCIDIAFGASTCLPTELSVCDIGATNECPTPSGYSWGLDDTYPIPSELNTYLAISWSSYFSGEVRFYDVDTNGDRSSDMSDCWTFSIPIGKNPTPSPTSEPTPIDRHPDWDAKEDSNLTTTILPIALGAVFLVVVIILCLWMRQQRQKRAMATVSQSNGLAKRLHEKNAQLQRQAREKTRQEGGVEMGTTTGTVEPTKTVTFEKRPLGFEVGFERIAALGGPALVVTKVTDESLGLKAKLAIVQLNGDPLQGKEPREMISLLKTAAFPFTIGFWDRSEEMYSPTTRGEGQVGAEI